MKRYIYLFIACVLSWTTAYAQPTVSYDFDSKVGTYEEISGGTVVGSGLLGEDFNEVVYIGSNEPCKDVVTKEGFPIGFDFLFSDQVMNQFAIGTNGYILLGKDEVSIKQAGSSFHTTGASANINAISSVTIGGVLGTEETELSYKVLGEAPNRVLVIQYKNWGLGNRWNDEQAAKAQFQFRLYETSNKIEMVYKDWKPTINITDISVRVGIKGSINNDRLVVKSSDDDDSWTENLVTVIDATSTGKWGIDRYPPDGLTYTFTPPADCEVPAAQPTNLQLASGSDRVTGTFNKVDMADHYLIIMSETPDLKTLPENGTIYKPEDAIGDAIVVSYDSIDTFVTPATLESAKSYYFHILAANSFCMFGPKYNTNTPLMGAVVTKPAKPEQLTIVESGLDRISLNAKANAVSDQLLIAVTTEPGLTEYGGIAEDGLFGQPSGLLNIGDAIEGGGKVIYKGEAKEGIVADGLLENTVYHFKAWSFNGDDNYSTIGATANDITWGRVPYIADFTLMPFYESPIGWLREGETFRIAPDLNDNNLPVLECNIQSADPTNGRENALTTPWILLSEGINRVVFDYNMSEWSRMGTTPYNNWNEDDLFEIQISKDGTNFETVYQVTKDKNVPKFATATSFVKLYAAFDQFAGEKVKIRVYWKCHKGIKLILKNFKIEEKSACDYPINLSVDESSLVGDQAKISWTSQGEETVWELRYRVDGTDGWNTPIEVRENPYLLSGLPAQTFVELQVRAKCSMTSQSDWSEILTFKTGYGVPFVETFSDAALPFGWSLESGALADPTIFCTENCSKQWEWVSAYRMKGLIMSPKGSSTDDWVLSPVVDLGDGSVNYIFNFELSMLTPQDNDETYSIVISTDGGKTFSNTNLIQTIEKTDLPDIGEKKMYSVSLKGYKGNIRMGVYVKSTTGPASMAQLTSVSFTESCPSDIVATVTDIMENSAKITWEGTSDTWLVFTRLAGDAKKEYKTQTAKELLLNDLEARTAYEVGITKMCEVGDTAKVVIAAFTTLALAPCEQVTDVEVVPAQYEATIRWTGEATAYNLRYRQKGMDEWIIRQTTENALLIEGLTPETEYEYAIQSVCSTAAGDVSEWTETASFKTLVVTCFPPTDIKVESITHKSAIVSWDGEADKYEVAYSKGSEDWHSFEVTARTVPLEDLEPETAYKVRVRSLCSATDISQWSLSTDFTTQPIPDCVTPTNLLASATEDSKVALTWDADEGNLSWDVRYREGAVTSWTTSKGLTEKKLTVGNLKENTVYLWSVKATCDEGRTSAWAAQDEFNSNLTGLYDTRAGELKVFISNQILNIVNPEHIWIEQLQIFAVNGQMIGAFNLNTDENVLLPLGESKTQLIIKLIGKQWSRGFQVVSE